MYKTVRIVPIVEGKGEVKAVPVLLRRIAREVAPRTRLAVCRPIRASRNRFPRRHGDFERYLNMAVVQGGPESSILILLDADDCPAEVGPRVQSEAERARADRRIKVVFARREYESWFLATLDSLLTPASDTMPAPPPNPEAIRGAKERLRRHLRYRPTADQTRLTRRLDLASARFRSPSFDKLWRAVTALLDPGT